MDINYILNILNIDINTGHIHTILKLRYKNEKKILFKATPLVDAIVRKQEPLITELFSDPKIDIFAGDKKCNITPAIACVVTNNIPLLTCILGDKHFNSLIRNNADPMNIKTTCTICFNENIPTNVKIDGCPHQFHKKCIDRWTKEFDAKTTNPTCPNCKKVYSNTTPLNQNYGINRKDVFGNTLLHYAVFYNHLKMFTFLLSCDTKRLNVISKNRWGDTVYSLIPNVNTIDPCKKIMFFKKLVHANYSLHEILIYACECDNVLFVKELIESKADVNYVGDRLVTPLVSAALYDGKNYSNNTKIIELLIDAGADMKYTDIDGDPIIVACLSSDNFNEEACKLLVDRGAPLDQVDARGYDVLKNVYDLYYDRKYPDAKQKYKHILPYIVNKYFSNQKYNFFTHKYMVENKILLKEIKTHKIDNERLERKSKLLYAENQHLKLKLHTQEITLKKRYYNLSVKFDNITRIAENYRTQLESRYTRAFYIQKLKHELTNKIKENELLSNRLKEQDE